MSRDISVPDHRLSSPELEAEYPEIVLERATSTQELLIHLYGHLNWHLGQIDYLRRIITDGTAVKATVDDKAVVLSGTVETEKQHALALRIAESYAGERGIKDKITIRGTT